MSQFRGISFPFRKGSTSFPEAATDDDLIKQSLIQLVLTGKGERVMRPDFGSSALAFIFENNDSLLYQRVEAEVMSLIAKYEPRVALLGVLVTDGTASNQQNNKDTTVIITISYVVLATKKTGSVGITLTQGGGNG